MCDVNLDLLLDRIKSKEEGAFEELYQLYYKRVYYFALQLSKNEQDAHDITQDTFMQLRKSLHSLKENRAFSVWLHRIIISKAGTLFRKNKTVSIPDDHILLKHRSEERGYMLPEKMMHFHSDKEMLAYFLKTLDEKYRVVLVLSYFSNLKIKEIAELLQVPEGTVKSRMSAGKEKLKEKIQYYQEREGVPLDFEAIDIAGVLTAFFVAKGNEIIIPSYFSLPKLKGMRSIANGITTQVVATSLLAVSGLAISYGVFQFYDEKNEKPDITMQTMQESDLDSNFSSVIYRGQLYENAEDAYYELTKWAHCGEEMSLYKKEEQEEIKVLYQALKQQNGVYWQLLQFHNWDQEFEKLRNK